MEQSDSPGSARTTIRDPLEAACLSSSDTVLAVLTDVVRAGYRRPGAMMAFLADGQTVGNLTNGCIEGDLALHAETVRSEGRVLHLRYGEGSPFFDIRLPCGGALDLWLFPVPDRQVLSTALRLRATRQPFGLAFDTASGQMGVTEPAATAGWQGTVFLVAERPAVRFVILGDGAEATHLVALAGALGYECRGSGPEDAGDLPLDDRTAVISFLHDDDREAAALAAALRSPAFYVGAQGSRRLAAARRDRLATLGLTGDALDRLVAPIGLVPSGGDARLLAVSVLAEVLVRANGQESTE